MNEFDNARQAFGLNDKYETFISSGFKTAFSSPH